MEDSITLRELIVYMLYAGLPVFLTVRVIQVIVLYSYKAPWKLIIATLLISQIIALVLEMTIWMFFKTDPIQHGISLPAVIAEIIIVLLTGIFIKATIKKWA